MYEQLGHYPMEEHKNWALLGFSPVTEGADWDIAGSNQSSERHSKQLVSARPKLLVFALRDTPIPSAVMLLLHISIVAQLLFW